MRVVAKNSPKVKVGSKARQRLDEFLGKLSDAQHYTLALLLEDDNRICKDYIEDNGGKRWMGIRIKIDNHCV